VQVSRQEAAGMVRSKEQERGGKKEEGWRETGNETGKE